MENEQQTTTEAEGDQAQPSAPPKRLVRRKDAGWYTGAAAGIAAYIGIDPIWVRLAFVVSSFFGGIGIAVYLVASFLPDATPAEVAAYPLPQRPYNQKWTTKEWYHGSGRFFSIIAIIAVALTVSSAWDFGGSNFLIAVLLAGAGLYLLSDADRAGVRERLFGAPASFVPGDATTTYEVPADYRPVVDPEIARHREERMQERRQARRDRRVLESITIGAVLLVVGVLQMLDRIDTYHFAVSTMLASALLVLGVAVVIGAWRGRSFLLVFLALLLTPFVIASNVVDGSVRDGVGERVWRPVDSAHIDSEYRLGVGHAELDLRDVRLVEGETRKVTVRLATGLIDVHLPEGAGYDVTANVEYGHLDVLNDEDESVGPNRNTQRSATGKGTIIIDAELDNGAIVVDQEGANR